MKDFAGKTAVITGAGSGFGLEFARLGASLGMRLVLADIQRDALDKAVQEMKAAGAQVIGEVVDVSRGDQVERLADRAFGTFGAVHLLFNNAGVATGGFVWEASERDWQWVLGVNLWGVIHGVHHFVPRMLASKEPGHIINTASVAGLLTAPNMGVYNVSKHAVVALTETLYHDLRLASAPIGVSVLCPAFVPTGIAQSERNRPQELADQGEMTASQRLAQEQSAKAVASGRVSAADVAHLTFDAIRDEHFYILSHPGILKTVRLRCEDVLEQRNPTDPYSVRPDLKPKMAQ